MTPRPIDVDGVPAVLWEVDDSQGSAIILPGSSRAGHRLGGIPARPDLHFTRALLLAHRLTVLELWWDAEAAPSGAEVEDWLLERALSAVAAAPTPLRLALGRSLGSRALAKLVVAGAAPSVLVWVAPLLVHPEVRRAAREAAPASCIVAGTADEATPRDDLRAVEDAGATMVRIEGASHGFEAGGSAADDARALALALDELDAFVRGALAKGGTF